MPSFSTTGGVLLAWPDGRWELRLPSEQSAGGVSILATSDGAAAHGLMVAKEHHGLEGDQVMVVRFSSPTEEVPRG